ncbi:MAG: EpsG family protein [Lachnospiraceae bacterium]|nr:EpsG family protein [Lachnospiraceae bacterium]
MILYLGVTLLSLVLAYFCNSTEHVQLHTIEYATSKGRHHFDRRQAMNLWVCMGIYVVLSAVAVCRIANSNDYWEYVEMFSLIAQKRHVSSEFGFNYFVRFMQLLFGREKYLPIFGAISLLTVFFFLKAIYDQGEWFLGSLFLFLMNGLYFSSFNSIRYYLVLAVVAYSTKFVIRGQYGRFILCIVLAATFHKSVLIVIPVYLLAKWVAENHLKWYHYVIGMALILSLVFCRELYRRVIFYFYEFYEDSAFDAVRYSYTNIGKCLGTCVLCAICYRAGLRDNARNRFYAGLNVMGLVTYTFGAFIPEVSRIGYYFTIGQIFLIPNLLVHMEKGWLKRVLIAGTALAFAAHFALFLRNAYSVDIRLLPYLNWIFN